MNAIEREILQDIFMRFCYFGTSSKYDRLMMNIADELIVRNAKQFLPELVDKIKKDKEKWLKINHAK
jgi:hypothetical protein